MLKYLNFLHTTLYYIGNIRYQFVLALLHNIICTIKWYFSYYYSRAALFEVYILGKVSDRLEIISNYWF